MTATSRTDSSRAAHALAELVVCGETDWFDSLNALRPVLPELVWVELCELLDLCPVHFCDADACRDDENDCPAGREAAAEQVKLHQDRTGRYGL